MKNWGVWKGITYVRMKNKRGTHRSTNFKMTKTTTNEKMPLRKLTYLTFILNNVRNGEINVSVFPVNLGNCGTVGYAMKNNWSDNSEIGENYKKYTYGWQTMFWKWERKPEMRKRGDEEIREKKCLKVKRFWTMRNLPPQSGGFRTVRNLCKNRKQGGFERCETCSPKTRFRTARNL